jgi:DNA-directed RNA polymerase subunit RPC12/RpoP
MLIGRQGVKRKKNKPCRMWRHHINLLKKRPNKCPHCKSRIKGRSKVVRLKVVQNKHNSLHVLAQCQTCKRAWLEEWVLNDAEGYTKPLSNYKTS